MIKLAPIKMILLLGSMLVLLLASCSDSAAPIYHGPEIKILKHTRTKDLEAAFRSFSYKLDNLEQGVPPLILQTLPKDLPEITSSKQKKRVFFKSLLPMILLANNEIRQDRAQILTLQQLVQQGTPLSENQLETLTALAKHYKIKSATLTSPAAFRQLLLRVDTIPAELAMAQAANESAWGTSRFSQEANNLFGEWTFEPGTGLIPEGRPEGATYEVRRFPTVYDSVRSYLRNLNTHFAYRELRLIRAQTRADNLPLDGSALAEGLLRYSIRGEEYVKDLQSLIRFNRLTRFTVASLRLSS